MRYCIYISPKSSWFSFVILKSVQPMSIKSESKYGKKTKRKSQTNRSNIVIVWGSVIKLIFSSASHQISKIFWVQLHAHLRTLGSFTILLPWPSNILKINSWALRSDLTLYKYPFAVVTVAKEKSSALSHLVVKSWENWLCPEHFLPPNHTQTQGRGMGRSKVRFYCFPRGQKDKPSTEHSFIIFLLIANWNND